ncbi:MAG: hypothetical protein J6V25_13320, partial [Oscillospiraceae bacterium]|nr:hypothetical protein [Oscillospiraceae bacterium]
MTRIYETQNYLMIHAAYRAPSCHSHQAAHILLGLEGTIAVTLNGEKQLCRGILIPPGISHTVDTAGKPVLVFLFDSRTSAAKQICNVRILPEQDCITLVQRYGAFCEDSCTYRQFERDLLEMLGMSQVISCVTDCRIEEALDYMRTRLSEPLTCRETAAAVCLSESRFSH